MDMKLDVVVLPVSDVDYADSGGYRVVQPTPPGSACSIIFGTGVTAARPGSIDRLVVAMSDVDVARDALRSRDVEVRVVSRADG